MAGVVVVGAGPVGFLTAIGLARSGIEVTMLEAQGGINSSPRAAVYFPTTLAVLDKLGLLEDAKAIGLPTTRFKMHFLDSGEAIEADLRDALPPDAPYDYNLHFGQHLLGELVLRHLERLPNARVLWSHEVIAIEQGDRAMVTASTPEGLRKIEADWVIGADGARSGVRQALGLPFEGFTWPERFVATNVEFDFTTLGFAEANMVMDPVHWAVCARLGKDRLWRVTYGEDASLDEASVGERIDEHYAGIFGPISGYRIDQFSPYRVHERCAPSFRVGRVLLAGDAAHVCNPCGGLGLTSGVIDADVLIDALTAVIEGRAGEDLLDFYAEERRRVFREITSPGASNFKRQMSEADPERRAEDRRNFIEGIKMAGAARATTMSSRILGEPLPIDP
jgi:2-polyprenyl-6-methoxyphenol hydroxylase-like FAD-dependent oxidoreductase